MGRSGPGQGGDDGDREENNDGVEEEDDNDTPASTTEGPAPTPTAVSNCSQGGRGCYRRQRQHGNWVGEGEPSQPSGGWQRSCGVQRTTTIGTTGRIWGCIGHGATGTMAMTQQDDEWPRFLL